MLSVLSISLLYSRVKTVGKLNELLSPTAAYADLLNRVSREKQQFKI